MPSDQDDIDFDEEWYLRTYPDVADAVRAGNIGSGLLHYLAHGRDEGRRPRAGFDAAWYAKAYPAVAGEVGSDAADALERHYRERGRYRGYLPYPQASRPRNAAEIASPFGGLWIDAANALDVIEGRRALGLINPEDAELLARFVAEGYVILPNAVPAVLLDRVENVVEAAFHGDMSTLLFECHAIAGGHVNWQPAILDQPAKALDLHWFSDAVRDAIFSSEILRFLHLIFERPVLASQTLTFYRGSQQPIHQDSAYVPYTLPLQFAATWIALEDVAEGVGELEYFVDSHRQLPEFLYNGMHKNVHEAQRSGAGDLVTEEVQQHLEAIQREAKERNLARQRFLARRGDVLVWHADLAHGGSPTASPRTRKSLVTHYCPSEVAPLFFENGQAVLKRHISGSFYTSHAYV
ncbi:MAG TPA: phytanoyl-CoA dioxygenase family protein [Stellaceae bacterium]|jgi:ectoine hydroxylase-related dioxygenase (phytanoyl-CoA dioxygenase family)|nr:phytanoyl-CoA dioxygenase family protein [Stellaceae bacterium]